VHYLWQLLWLTLNGTPMMASPNVTDGKSGCNDTLRSVSEATDHNTDHTSKYRRPVLERDLLGRSFDTMMATAF
jgi:hypothetical protein